MHPISSPNWMGVGIHIPQGLAQWFFLWHQERAQTTILEFLYPHPPSILKSNMLTRGSFSSAALKHHFQNREWRRSVTPFHQKEIAKIPLSTPKHIKKILTFMANSCTMVFPLTLRAWSNNDLSIFITPQYSKIYKENSDLHGKFMHPISSPHWMGVGIHKAWYDGFSSNIKNALKRRFCISVFDLCIGTQILNVPMPVR